MTTRSILVKTRHEDLQHLESSLLIRAGEHKAAANATAPSKDSDPPKAASPQGQCFNLPTGSCHSPLPLSMFTCQSFRGNTVLLVYYSPGSVPSRVKHLGADRDQTLLAIRGKKRTVKSLKTAFLTTYLLASKRKAVTV